MRNWILLAVALGAAWAGSARAQSDGGAPPPPPAQVVVVPEAPPPPATDGGAPLVTDVPTAADGGASPVAAGEADAGTGEEIILLVPKKPPPPPEPPRQIHVTVMHTPRPRVEWGQASLELGVSTGVFVVGSAALFLTELVPIFIADRLFNARPVANGMVDVFAVANAALLPLASTIAIDKMKAYSRHYELEGMGWWATYGAGFVLQAISAAITIATLDVDTYLAAPHVVVLSVLTPISQTVVAQVLATPRDPLSPLEGTARAPVLLDGRGRPIPIVRVLSFAF